MIENIVLLTFRHFLPRFLGFLVQYSQQGVIFLFFGCSRGKDLEMMFQVNDYVFHKHCGVCLVQAIAPLPGDNSGAMYYVLSPLFGDDKGNIVRVPVDYSGSLNTPITKDEASFIVDNWPTEGEELYIVDSKKRKLSYEAALSSGVLNDLIPLLEGALRRKERDGHLNSMDSQFVNRAAPLVFGSISMALGINYKDVGKYIQDHLA